MTRDGDLDQRSQGGGDENGQIRDCSFKCKKDLLMDCMQSETE